jgi:hypothetical protein
MENPEQSKFCRKCGTPLGVRLRCPSCNSENPGDSLFCTECGEKLSAVQKPAKGNQRKCKDCGHFNELDALFCVACGEEIIKVPPKKDRHRRPSPGPSYKTIALIVGGIFLLGLLVKAGMTLFKDENASRVSSPSPAVSASLANVDEPKVLEVARNFKCACGGCGELPLDTCDCDMPNGALGEKTFIREKLGEGLSVQQVIEFVNKKYGHRT